ncbi:hypothetical protein BD309DRAFT_733386 [Dichomitus squalens]|uniref:Uncharacterized protein n=1 Tax=Dichomitus squalens TaxID=114155 RepID=A0A4V2K4P7_9APHY|nr:hypothetical protein BD309DRAFT_733386 [Dichomitus squalens]TBU61440.1 hypothetical protein BD310DRAFT_195489 [Dichomitus squalens]
MAIYRCGGRGRASRHQTAPERRTSGQSHAASQASHRVPARRARRRPRSQATSGGRKPPEGWRRLRDSLCHAGTESRGGGGGRPTDNGLGRVCQEGPGVGRARSEGAGSNAITHARTYQRPPAAPSPRRCHGSHSRIPAPHADEYSRPRPPIFAYAWAWVRGSSAPFGNAGVRAAIDSLPSPTAGNPFIHSGRADANEENIAKQRTR